jgi:hypothetical protein
MIHPAPQSDTAKLVPEYNFSSIISMQPSSMLVYVSHLSTGPYVQLEAETFDK